MKPAQIITRLAIAKLTLLSVSSCSNHIPEEDNQFVMMRRGDIQIQEEVQARQTYFNNNQHKINIIRFIRELFYPNTPKNTATTKIQTSAK